jgi:phospholipid/cholesterol/gamma-HCH transport system substrate-binding protein
MLKEKPPVDPSEKGKQVAEERAKVQRKHTGDVMLGAVILAALGLLAYMAIAVGGLKFGDAVHVTAEFDNATGLVKEGAVMIAGVNVGSVESLSVRHDKAVVKLRLRQDAQIRQDVKAAIRAKSLLGEKYVELLPQSTDAPLIAQGAVITDTTVPVEVDELLTHLGPVIKDIDPKDLQAIVHSVAQGLNGQGPQLAAAITSGASTLGRLDGMLARNEGKLDSMISSLDRVSRNADGLLERNEKRLDATLALTPDLLKRLDRMGTQLDPTMTALANKGPSLVNRLDRLGEQLDPTMAALSTKGPGIVNKADRTLAQLDPTLSRLPNTLEQLDKLVGRLDTSMAHIEAILEQTKGKEMVERDGALKVKARLF